MLNYFSYAPLARIIGGSKYLWIISHPKIVDLFLEMSNINKVNELRKLIRENIDDEEIKNRIINSLPRKSLVGNNMSYPAIKTRLQAGVDNVKLDSETSNDIVKWLLNKNLFRQGKTVRCNTCYTTNWVSINKFDSTIICSGCANSIKIPFGIDKIDWEYQINTLISAGIDQGLLIHLLTGFQIIDGADSPYRKRNLYGLYYGLNFISGKNGKNKEIDIAFFIDGQLVIGECKVSGKDFSDQVIQDEVDFARKVKSSKIILSCFEDVEELENTIKNINLEGIEITILGKNDLLCQFPGQSLEKQINEEEKTLPINKAKHYKQNLEFLKDNHMDGFG